MGELTRSQVLVYAVVALVVVGLGVRYLRSAGQPSAAAPGGASVSVSASDEGEGARAATVHVAGAVRQPGVYRLRTGARVDDAVRRAGGATARADLTQLNLAAKVEDGRQVLVPELVDVAAGGGGGASAPAPAPGQPLNLNTATLEQLDALDGIGPATAQAILDFRDEHDGFGSVDELGEVPGIGEVRLASLREQVRV